MSAVKIQAVPLDEKRPLEWWEEIQVNFIEKKLGMVAEAAHYRAHPEVWRRVRAEINALK